MSEFPADRAALGVVTGLVHGYCELDVGYLEVDIVLMVSCLLQTCVSITKLHSGKGKVMDDFSNVKGYAGRPVLQ